MKYSHFLLSGITGWMLCLYPYCATAELPSGGDIVSGAGTVSQSGNTLTVNQSTNKLSVNWDNFNIGADNTVQFIQPDRSSIALNRVVGSDGSRIMGKLLANGQVFLINPNGILFGQTAQVDVGGLVASTLNLSEDDFRNGNMVFRGDGGEVINRGVLQSELGYLALLGSHVSNEGTLLANYGTVALAAGNQITLDFSGDQLINVGVDAAAFNALAENKQLIRADGGKVIMTARATGALFDTVVSNEGIIEARTLSERNGVIVLLGDMEQGTVNVDGVLDASAPEGGDGGFIETSGAHVKVADTAHITTLAPHGETGQWLLDPVDFTIAASGGDVTGSFVSTALASNNVMFQTDAATAGNGDIFVNDSISWNAATTLTLSAHRNIDVTQAVTATGAGNLVLRADSDANGTGTVNFGGSGAIAVGSGRADLYYNPAIDYITPTDYSGNITGAYTAWMLVNDVTDLQNISANLTGDYALGADIDASATSGWNGGQGFNPIGNSTTSFTGNFDGLGHVISNLFINRSTSFIGLFGSAGAGSTISNVGLAGGSITGDDRTGGLVGTASGATISNSYVTATVTGDIWTGGLVGLFSGSTVTNSYATGNVTGSQMVGGLIGWSNGTISYSYASGLVTNSTGYVGGFIGYHPSGTITSSFWNTETSGQTQGTGNSPSTSGLTGLTSAGMMTASNFATWDPNVWRIYDGYTTPLLKVFMTPVTVTANNDSKTYDAATYTGTPGVTYSDPSVAGSLLGTLSYASSGINAGTYALSTTGLYSDQQGYDITFVDGTLTINQAAITLSTSDVIKTYDGTTSAAGTAAVTSGSLFGSDSLSGGTFAFTDPNAGTGKTVSVSGITVNDGNGGGNYAVTYADNTTSTINQAALTLTSSDVIKTYDGTTTAAGTAQVASGSLFGSDSLSGGTFAFADRNAGTNKTVTVANITVNDGNGGNNYTVTYVDNTTSTINQATLTLTSSDVIKTYDGTTTAAGTAQVASGSLFGSDSLSGGTFAFADRNAGTNKTVTVTNITVNDGNGGNNYTVTYVDNTTSTINQAALTLTSSDVIKTYDGTTTAAGTAQVASGSLFGSDSLGGGTFTFTDPNAGTNKTVTVTNVTVNDGNGGNNYTVTYVDNTTSTINQATLTITADDQSIVAGNMIPLLTATAVGLVAGDTNSLITGLSTTATSSSPAGSYVIDASGASAGPNYLIAVANDGTLTITAAPVTTPPISDINDTIGNTIGITINNPSLNPNQPGFIDDDADGESAIRTNREQQANTVMQFDRIALNIADGGIKMPSATVIQTCHSSKEDEGFAVTDCIEVKQHSGYIIQP